MKIYYTEFNSNCISVIVESFKKIGFTLLDRTIKLIQENLGDDAFLVAIDNGNDDNIVKYIGNDVFAEVIKNHQCAERLKINGPIYKEGDIIFDKKKLCFFNIIYVFDGKYVVKTIFNSYNDNIDYEFNFVCQDDWIYIGNDISNISLDEVIEYVKSLKYDNAENKEISEIHNNSQYCFCIENIMPGDILSTFDGIIVVNGINVNENKIYTDTTSYDFDNVNPVLLYDNYLVESGFHEYEEDGIIYFVYMKDSYSITIRKIDLTHYKVESMDLIIQFVHDLQHIIKNYSQR